jgi:hypothetical protein
MPPPAVNIVLSTGAIIAVTVVAAAAIAIYESPEVRQFAEECRRRVAHAFHSLGDNIYSESGSRQPRFNRPEDAEGFFRSRAETGVDGDEESQRRQREELMYWNRLREQKLRDEEEKAQGEAKNRSQHSRGATFDDFLHEDKNAEEKGTFVYNSSADVYGNAEDNLIHRRAAGLRGIDRGSMFANPFSDENAFELESQRAMDCSLIAASEQSEKSDISEDLYGADDDIRPSPASTKTLSAEPEINEKVVEDLMQLDPSPEIVPETSPVPVEGETPIAIQGPYASIHAWADDSQRTGFYSPLPVEPQTVSEQSDDDFESGQVTPTDSMSLAGSGVDVNIADGEYSAVEDNMSEDGRGISTPGSWSEVGSIVSESEGGRYPREA